MRKNRIVAYGLTVLMTASMLAGCGSTDNETVDESEAYMSQFAEYEDGSNSTSDGSSVGTDSTMSNVASGEKIFEDTLFDGNPIDVVEDAEKTEESESENAEPTKAPEKPKKKVKKTALIGAPTTATTEAPTAAPTAAPITDAASQAVTVQVAETTVETQPVEQPPAPQTIENPTENNSSSDNSSGSSDTGSGISQTCDDDNGSNAPSNSASSEEIIASFE